MTLIVGILCQDGIVVGADGAASLGVMGQMTARQPTKKLALIQDCMIVGVSGTVGLSQRIAGMMQRLHEGMAFRGKDRPVRPDEALATIRTQIWTEILEMEFKVANLTQPVLGNNISRIDASCFSIIALPISKQLCLFQLDQQGHPEMASKDLPFVAIGSGQHGADPFLSFLRRIFWPDHQPNLAEGIFATVWTLDHAIKTSPGGVADPMQIATLQIDKNGKASCRELCDNDLAMHREAVTNAEKYLREFNLQKAPALAQPIPIPPAK